MTVGIDGLLRGSRELYEWQMTTMSQGLHNQVELGAGLALDERLRQSARRAGLTLYQMVGDSLEAGVQPLRNGPPGVGRPGRGLSVCLDAPGRAIGRRPQDACFSGETKLKARGGWGDGWRHISQIQVGDEVLSRDENDANSPLEWKKVEEKFVRLAPILHVHVGGQVIRTTAEHPFYPYTKGWTSGGALEVGDCLVGHSGPGTPVEDLFDTGEWTTVYNLRVADHHTYFVGGDHWGFSVWAHNTYTTPENASRVSRQAAAEENGMSSRRLNSRGGAANPNKGNAARDALAARISKNKNVLAVKPEVTLQTPGGGRRFDLRVTLRNGRTVFIEVKWGTGRLTPMQAAKDAFLRRQGFIITIVRVP